MYKKVKNSWLKHIDFTVLDLICYEIAFLLAYMLRHGFILPYEVSSYRHMSIVIVLIHTCIVFFLESYKSVLRRGYFQELKETFHHVTWLVLLLFAYMFLAKSSSDFSRTVLLVFWGLSLSLSYIGRLILKSIVRKKLERGVNQRAVIAVTSKELAVESIQSVRKKAYRDYRITGLIILDEAMVGEEIMGVPVVGSISESLEYLKTAVVDEVFINLPPDINLPKDLMDGCVAMGITMHLNLYEVSKMGGNKTVESFADYTVVTSSIRMASPKQLFFKRMLDIMGGLVGVALTGIIFLFVAPVIKIQSPGPVFFSQIRVGKNGRRFKIYKFRSMYMDAEERKAELMAQNEMEGFMFKMKEDPRIFPFGHFLRNSSLDEFPQFFNVLIGDKIGRAHV